MDDNLSAGTLGAAQGLIADDNRLRENSLGFAALTFMVVSAAAPLTGVAGVLPIAFMLGNGTGLPATFLCATLVMLLFSVGYVAMARHVRNAGAFYAYAARGLGGCWGGATAIVALVAYNAMQWGLIGMFGAIAASLFAGYGVNAPWWLYSLVAIVLVSILGYRQVDLSAKVLGMLVIVEYMIVLLVDFVILGKGGAHGLATHTFNLGALTSGSFPVAILFCLGSFMGFEATTIYAEEARNPEKTVPRATYAAVLVIGFFYIFTSWLMIAGTGPTHLISTLKSLKDPTNFFFDLARRYVGGPVPDIAQLLLVSSLFAALSAFHNYIARYSYVAGREGLLPAMFGRTHSVHQSPHIGSVAQTMGALLVLAFFAGFHLDPILDLFTWICQIGVLGLVGMMTITSVAVVAFFQREGGVSRWKTLAAPVASGLIMAVLFVYIYANFGELTGTNGKWLGIALPTAIPVAALVGWALARRLRTSAPELYAGMGASRS